MTGDDPKDITKPSRRLVEEEIAGLDQLTTRSSATANPPLFSIGFGRPRPACYTTPYVNGTISSPFNRLS
jgi:hypothetical protein